MVTARGLPLFFFLFLLVLEREKVPIRQIRWIQQRCHAAPSSPGYIIRFRQRPNQTHRKELYDGCTANVRHVYDSTGCAPGATVI